MKASSDQHYQQINKRSKSCRWAVPISDQQCTYLVHRIRVRDWYKYFRAASFSREGAEGTECSCWKEFSWTNTRRRTKTKNVKSIKIWRCEFFAVWCCIVRWVVPYVSKDRNATFFWAKQSKKNGLECLNVVTSTRLSQWHSIISPPPKKKKLTSSTTSLQEL